MRFGNPIAWILVILFIAFVVRTFFMGRTDE